MGPTGTRDVLPSRVYGPAADQGGEPASFGITVELLMLSSAAAIVEGLYIGAESSGAGGDTGRKGLPK